MQGTPDNMHKTTTAGGSAEVNDPPGQRHRVRTLREVARARRDPLAAGTIPTRLGCFERAAHHRVRRPGGLEPLVLLCLTGQGWIEAGGRRRRLRAGEAAWIDCRKRHGYGSHPEHPWTIAWTHLTGTQLVEWERRLTRSGRRHSWKAGGVERAQAAFESLWHAVEHGAGDVRIALACAAWLLELAPDGASKRESGERDSIEAIAQELRREPGRPVSWQRLAAGAGCSPGHLSARFRMRWGCPPHRYQIRQRMQRACTLLETTTLKIAAVAAEVGYDNPFYFSRLFRRTFGVSPREFRERGQ